MTKINKIKVENIRKMITLLEEFGEELKLRARDK
jgi:hypothetical protein